MRAPSLTSTNIIRASIRRAATALLAIATLSACTIEATTGTDRPGSDDPRPVTVQRVELSGASWLVEQVSASYSARIIGSNGSELLDRAVAWTSSDTAVLSLVGSGVVYAKRAGEVTLSARADDKVASLRVVVRPLTVDTVRVTLSGAVHAGETAFAGAELRAADGRHLDRPVAWTSLDPSVATVDGQGKVTGIRPGSVVIVATSEGRTGQAQVTVRHARAGGTWTISIPDLRNGSTICSYTNLSIGLEISGSQVRGDLMYDVWTGGLTGTLSCVALVGGSGVPSEPVIPAGPFTGTINENGYMVLSSANGWQLTGMVNRDAKTWTGSVVVRDGDPVNGIVPVRVGTFSAMKP